jgi:hypothetical protein
MRVEEAEVATDPAIPGPHPFDTLMAYTWTRGDAGFIHQLAVDAYGAQNAHERTKPIGLTFALIGLYLAVEKGWSGKQVQRAHMLLGRRRRAWPSFALPLDRGSMTIADVLAHREGPERDEAIHRWCRAVWAAFASSRPTIVALLAEYDIV